MTEPTTPYWRRNRRIVALLLVLWAIVGLGLGIVFVEPLNEIRMGGFKLGFWFAHQGSIFGFVILIAVYAVWMDRVEAQERGRARSQGSESRTQEGDGGEA